MEATATPVSTLAELKKEHVFLLLKNNFGTKDLTANKTFTNVPAVDNIITKDPKTGDPTERIIRYYDGCQSIYQDEQPKEVKPEKIRSIIFEDDYKIVVRSQIKLLEFLAACNYNASNPNKREDSNQLFKLLDPRADAMESLAKINVKYDAITAVRNMNTIELQGFMLSLYNDPGRIHQLQALSKEELLYSALAYAEGQPEGVMKTLSSKKHRMRIFMNRAVGLRYIVYNANTQVITWDTGEEILRAPFGKNAIDHFIALAQTDADFKMLFKDIQERVERQMAKEQGVSMPVEEMQKEIEQLKKEDWTDGLIKECLDAGVISKSGHWFNIKGEQKTRINSLKERLREDTEFVSKLTSFLNKNE